MSPRNFPFQPTAFIGRKKEVADMVDTLAEPACRLLTVVGPGGVGKTRLAVRVAQMRSDDFAEGSTFVDLQPVEKVGFLPAAIADAVKLSLSGQQAPEAQLRRHLQRREVLLLLDNFEHLLPGGAEVIGRIVAEAPDVKLLVTSREALNLREEWLYPLRGLSFPDAGQDEHENGLAEYDAVALFAEQARRVRPDFSLTDEGRAAIRICQLVAGLPLALELAASWVRVMDCATIAAKIRENVDFLSSNLRNAPDRHRSIKAVFDHSWRLFSPDEQGAYQRLSVFRGAFTAQAAQEVAGATLRELSNLVDKSLLRRSRDDQYQLHELLRQYVAAKLDDAAQVRQRHCDYYIDLLAQYGDYLKGGRQQEAIAEVERHRENVRAAWQHAVAEKRVAAIRQALYPYAYFAEFNGRYAELVNALESALSSVELASPARERDLALAEVLVLLGWSYIRVGRHNEARRVLERGRALYDELGTAPPEALSTDPLLGLAILAIISGNYDRALSLAREGLHLSEERGDPHNRQLAFYALSSASLAQGQYGEAQRYARQAYAVTQKTRNEWFRAYVLNDLGRVAQAVGEYEEALQHYEASFGIKASFNDPEGQAVALNHLGAVALLKRDVEKASDHYRRSLAIYEEIGDRGGLATALNGLGNTALAQDKLSIARRRLRQALEVAAEIRFVPLILSVLTDAGELFLRVGQSRRGAELLALVQAHPAGEEVVKARARRYLEQTGEVPERPAADLPAADLVAHCQTVLDDLRALRLPEEDEDGTEEDGRGAAPAEQPLVEPLTEREVEVLQQIARGLTNRQIAEELVISVGTVKWYTSQIYGKLDVGNRTAAVARARKLGLLS